MTSLSKHMRDTDIAMYKLFKSKLGDNEDFAAALDAVEDVFGEVVCWPVEVYMGIISPYFTYGDGVEVDFNDC